MSNSVDENIQTPDTEITLSGLADSLDLDGGEEESGDELDVTDEEGEESESEDDVDASDEQDEGEEEEEQEESTVTLKRDGKEVSVPLSKAIELAQMGHDYTQKTQALAEERKAFEAQRSEVTALREREHQALESAEGRLRALNEFLESQIGTPPSIELAQRDPAGYLAQKELYEARKSQLKQVSEAADATQSEVQRKRQARLAEEAQATEKALSDTLPGWNDTLMNGLADYLIKAGISPDSAVEAFVKKGVWELAHKAKQFDELQAKKAELKPKVELKKVQKPSAARVQTREDAKFAEKFKAHRAKPSINSLADLM